MQNACGLDIHRTQSLSLLQKGLQVLLEDKKTKEVCKMPPRAIVMALECCKNALVYQNIRLIFVGNKVIKVLKGAGYTKEILGA